MPAELPASPAVVIVLTPSTKEIASFGTVSGSQRSGAGAISAASALGAVRHRPMSARSNLPQWAIVGRMR